MIEEVFLDTSFAIALSAVTDRHHLKAVELSAQIEFNGNKLVTTQAILLEIGNALSRQRYRWLSWVYGGNVAIAEFSPSLNFDIL